MVMIHPPCAVIMLRLKNGECLSSRAHFADLCRMSQAVGSKHCDNDDNDDGDDDNDYNYDDDDDIIIR